MTPRPRGAALAMLLAAGCVTARAVHISSDPNQDALDRLEEKNESANVEAFIAQHPELSEGTRKALRDGTLSRHEVLRQEKAGRHP